MTSNVPARWENQPIVAAAEMTEKALIEHMSDQHDVRRAPRANVVVEVTPNPWKLHEYLHWREQGDGHTHRS